MTELTENKDLAKDIASKLNTELPKSEPIIRCTRNDEFITKPCECPECLKEQNTQYQEAAEEFGKNLTVVTDEYLSPDIQAVWSGFIFYCPSCKNPSIMVNKDLGKFCSYCGQPVVVKSHALTNYIRKLQENKRI